ncbi:UbiA family prenyltransferase [Deinococcus maricopensis]|uniref:UbiA prenyltransferase n=1 Tax=Deinococcus maricopensis (strain DSM 21211 / LMG 22137 / NRRL B-23946 / LB-34) TaxID=709986 RepID=E8UAM1_DEIML|nr:UbiA family prenyltransferase [Deinococcus maricopensis]ADV68110.1 UbiA prenyltransferase [Deinococcus maricopensis DSM 21211]
MTTGRTLTPARLLLIARPALWVNTLGVAVTGLWLTGTLWTFSAWWLTLLAYLTLPFNLLIYGLNDLADHAEDAANPRKGGVQGAQLLVAERRPLLGWITALNGPFLVALALLLPSAALGVLLLAGALFAAYSVPPARLKARPFLDGLSNVAYALPLAVPALALGHTPNANALGALMAYSVGKHAFDAIQDLDVARLAGVRTVATRLGVRGAVQYAGAWFVLAGALLLPLSVVSAAAVWLVAGGLALRLLQTPDVPTARRLYPASIISPWLIGAASGVQLVYHLARGHALFP